MIQIPTLSDGTAYYSLRTNLDGVDYQLDFRWSTREGRWYLTLRDTQGNLLCGEIKVLANWPMLRWYHDREGVPAGELVAICLQPSVIPPGLTELGIGLRTTLYYIPAGTV